MFTVIEIPDSVPGRTRPPKDATDLDMIKNPNWWPHCMLPLKRDVGNKRELGVCVYDGDQLLLAEDHSCWQSLMREDADEITAEEVIERGWVVD